MKTELKNVKQQVLEQIKQKIKSTNSNKFDISSLDELELEKFDISYSLWFEGKEINHYKLQEALKNAGLCYVENTSNIYIDCNNVLEPLESIAHWCDEDFFPAAFKGWSEEETYSKKARTKEIIKKGIESQIFSLPFYKLSNNFLTDTKDTCYLFIADGVLEVTKHHVKVISYKQLPGGKKVLKNQIKTNLLYDPSVDWKQYRSLKFYEAITEGNNQKYEYLQTLLGASIWRYKIPGRNRIPIFVDGFADTKKVGGTGKSLIVRNLNYIVNVCTIHNPIFNRFLFQTVNIGVDIVYFEDVLPQNLKMNKIRCFMDAHLEVEKKGRTPIILKDENCPSAIVTTNYILHDGEDADKGRVWEFCMPEIFRRGVYGVYDLLGYYMFDDYNEDDWKHYLAFMIHCVQLTLQYKGVAYFNEDTLLRKKELLDKQKNVDFEMIFNYLRKLVSSIKNNKYIIDWESIQEELQQKVDKKFTSTNSLRDNLRTLIETEFPDFTFETNRPYWNKNLQKTVKGDVLLNNSLPIEAGRKVSASSYRETTLDDLFKIK